MVTPKEKKNARTTTLAFGGSQREKTDCPVTIDPTPNSVCFFASCGLGLPAIKAKSRTPKINPYCTAMKVSTPVYSAMLP